MSTNMPTEQKGASSGGDVHTGNLIDAKHEGHRKYLILGRDNEKIERTAAELLEGTRALQNRELLTANLIAVFQGVAKWCEEHSSVIQIALLIVRTEKLCFYFVPKSERYDLALDAEMTELEVKLSSAGVGYVESFQIAERNLERLNGDRVIQIWKQSPSA